MCRPFEHVFEVCSGGGGFLRVGECGYEDILSKVPFWDLTLCVVFFLSFPPFLFDIDLILI